jgi:hypothetical protein
VSLLFEALRWAFLDFDSDDTLLAFLWNLLYDCITRQDGGTTIYRYYETVVRRMMSASLRARLSPLIHSACPSL